MNRKIVQRHPFASSWMIGRGVALLLLAVGGASCGAKTHAPKERPVQNLMTELARARIASDELLNDVERAARHVTQANEEWSVAREKFRRAEDTLRRNYEAVNVLRVAKEQKTFADLGGRIPARDVPAALEKAVEELQRANRDYDAALAAKRQAEKRRSIALRTYRDLKEQRQILRLQVAELENKLRTLALRTVERDAQRKIALAMHAAQQARENLTIASAALDYEIGQDEPPHIPIPGQKERERKALIQQVMKKIGSNE